MKYLFCSKFFFTSIFVYWSVVFNVIFGEGFFLEIAITKEIVSLEANISKLYYPSASCVDLILWLLIIYVWYFSVLASPVYFFHFKTEFTNAWTMIRLVHWKRTWRPLLRTNQMPANVLFVSMYSRIGDQIKKNWTKVSFTCSVGIIIVETRAALLILHSLSFCSLQIIY